MGIGLIPAAGLVAGKLSGFGIYLATTTGLGAISSAIGVTFPWAVYQGTTTVLGVMLGPIGWAIAGASVATGGIVFLSQVFKRSDQKLTPVVIAIILSIGDNSYEWFGLEDTAALKRSKTSLSSNDENISPRFTTETSTRLLID